MGKLTKAEADELRELAGELERVATAVGGRWAIQKTLSRARDDLDNRLTELTEKDNG